MAPEESKPLELRDYLRVLRRHKWIIMFTVVASVGVAVAMALTRAPVYVAGSNLLLERRLVDTLFVPTEQVSSSNDDRRRSNEIAVMGSPRIRTRVAELLGRAPDEVTFEASEGSDVVRIAAKGNDAKDVAETANAFASVYVEVRAELVAEELNEVAAQLQTQKAEVDAQILELDNAIQATPNTSGTVDPRQIERNALVSRSNGYDDQIDRMLVGAAIAQQGRTQILLEASPPDEPTNKDPVRNGLAGLAIGLVLGVALAFLREYLDDSIKTKEDLEAATGLTVVGIVPTVPEWKKSDTSRLVVLTQPRSVAAEAYRSVRTSVEFLSLDQPIGSLQVTSALASEGKTSTLANLATTFAAAGQRVIVLCCDLRRPQVHEFFGLSNRVGFTSVLLGDASLATAIQPADQDLPIGLVASGPLPPNPAELLSSKRAVDAIEELDRRCDLLLIDSPPVLPVTDALVISGLVDGVLVVGRAGESTKRGIKRATELLRQVDAPLIGGILNDVHSKSEYAYAYGDNRYYLDFSAPETKRETRSRNGRGRKRPSVPVGR